MSGQSRTGETAVSDRPRTTTGRAPDPAGVDLAGLADKVYRLMRDELRLEKARGQKLDRRKGR